MRRAMGAVVVLVAAAAAGCGSGPAAPSPGPLKVVATTTIVAELVGRVGGARLLVPSVLAVEVWLEGGQP